MYSLIAKGLAFVKPFLPSQAPDQLWSGDACTANSIPPDVDMPAVEDKETYSSSFCQMLADVRQYMVHTDTHYPYSGCSESLSVRVQIKGDTGRPRVNPWLVWVWYVYVYSQRIVVYVDHTLQTVSLTYICLIIKYSYYTWLVSTKHSRKLSSHLFNIQLLFGSSRHWNSEQQPAHHATSKQLVEGSGFKIFLTGCILWRIFTEHISGISPRPYCTFAHTCCQRRLRLKTN